MTRGAQSLPADDGTAERNERVVDVVAELPADDHHPARPLSDTHRRLPGPATACVAIAGWVRRVRGRHRAATEEPMSAPFAGKRRRKPSGSTDGAPGRARRRIAPALRARPGVGRAFGTVPAVSTQRRGECGEPEPEPVPSDRAGVVPDDGDGPGPGSGVPRLPVAGPPGLRRGRRVPAGVGPPAGVDQFGTGSAAETDVAMFPRTRKRPTRRRKADEPSAGRASATNSPTI